MTVFALLAFALLLVAAGLIARPFVAPVPDDEIEVDGEDDFAPALRDERRRLLEAIRELDADLTVGKLSEADHRELRAAYVARAAATMQQLDEARARRAQADPAPSAELRVHLEDEIRSRREALRVVPCPRCGTPLSGASLDHSCGEPAAVGEEVGRG